MNIQPNKLTLSQLFANENEQFIIPSYQRRYSWEINHIGALFNDIKSLQDGDGHLFGMIILHTSIYNYNSIFMSPELVDGQQRLTTLTILLKSLEKAYKKLQRNSTYNDIKRMLHCKSRIDKSYKSKLLLGDLDYPDYEKIMSNENFNEIKNGHLKNAIEKFDTWVSELSEDELDIFYYKLINVAVIIRLDVVLAQDAYKLFETINNRGLKLSATDIIKNFLLGHASKINDNTTLDKVKSIWSEIIINLDKINTDNFFRQYFCSVLKRKITFNRLVSDFKIYYTKNVEHSDLLNKYEMFNTSIDTEEDDYIFESDVYQRKTNEDMENDTPLKEMSINAPKMTIIEFLNRIKKSSLIYKKMCYKDFEENWLNNHMNNLLRIQCLPSFIFLMHFLQKEYSKKTQLSILLMIETFMLRRHICKKRTGENDSIFSYLVESLDEKTEEKILYSFRKRLKSHYPDDVDFLDKLASYQFEGKVEERARYILEQLEYNKRGSYKELSINTAENVQLEHIIPKNITTKKSSIEFGDWLSYLGENAQIRHKKYVSKIGNLTLLAAPLNIQASNNPFRKKLNSYNQSNLIITKELGNYLNFTFTEVEKRSNEITEEALKIWRIDFSDIPEE